MSAVGVCVVGSTTSDRPRYFAARFDLGNIPTRKRIRREDVTEACFPPDLRSVTLLSRVYGTHATLDTSTVTWPHVVLQLEAPLHHPVAGASVTSASQLEYVCGDVVVVSGCSGRCEIAAPSNLQPQQDGDPVVCAPQPYQQVAMPSASASALTDGGCRVSRRELQVDPFDATIVYQSSDVRLLEVVRRGRLDSWWCRELPPSDRERVIECLRRQDTCRKQHAVNTAATVDSQHLVRVKSAEMRRVVRWWALGDAAAHTPLDATHGSSSDIINKGSDVRTGGSVSAKVERLLKGLNRGQGLPA